ncbi:MAG TPA: amidohydrolase family protein, partial [Alphaproteobacteria bacterium]|nr:amidohydrolase family protein [Alphaproteobacteria bacterium]
AYMKRFYYDTCVYNPDMLRYLAGKVGAGRIVMGSDYPVFLKEPDPVGFVKKLRGISAAQRQGILGGTAAKLLKLKSGKAANTSSAKAVSA